MLIVTATLLADAGRPVSLPLCLAAESGCSSLKNGWRESADTMYRESALLVQRFEGFCCVDSHYRLEKISQETRMS